MTGKPKLILLTTGGTISTLPDKDAARLKAEDFLRSIPEIHQFADIEGRDVLAKPSASFTLDDIGLLAGAVEKAAQEADGIVITHGTDTLEETAFALSLLIKTDKPVILTGALRRAQVPGTDGPANLIAACRVAAAPVSRGKGILVVFNDEIHSALFVEKSNSFLPNAFTSLGPLGWVAEDRVRFLLQPVCQPPKLSLGNERPAVPLIETGLFLEKKIISTLCSEEFEGIVLNATGVGHISSEAADILEKFVAKRPAVFASRAGRGETFRATYTVKGAESDLIQRGLIPAGWLSGRQARVALVLMLSAGASLAEVISYFSGFSEG